MAKTLERGPFVFSPALVHKKTPINYRTAEGSKIFKGVTVPPPLQSDYTSNNLQFFLMNSETDPSCTTGITLS
jgi:hypothetical protein